VIGKIALFLRAGAIPNRKFSSRLLKNEFRCQKIGVIRHARESGYPGNCEKQRNLLHDLDARFREDDDKEPVIEFFSSLLEHFLVGSALAGF
jgi:hypothetical protein